MRRGLCLALFGPDTPGWRRLFLRVKRLPSCAAGLLSLTPKRTAPFCRDAQPLWNESRQVERPRGRSKAIRSPLGGRFL
jgi:hypothetical protein